MGQSQLLLVVLGVVLVGIAIVAGIQAYDNSNRKSSVDLLVHEALTIATDLQLWAQKPAQFGGPVRDASLPESASPIAKATLEKIGHKKSDDVSLDACSLSDLTETSATITCQNASLGTEAVVMVTGLSHRDISLVSTKLR